MSSVEDLTSGLFEEEPVEEKKVKVHYFRFDNKPIKMADGTEIIPFAQGWDEVGKFLGSTEPKDMLKKLIGLAMLANQGKIALTKVESETPTETETSTRRRRS